MALGVCCLLLWHVRQGSLIGGDLDIELEGGFQIGFIEAREGASSIAGLELGREHVVILGVVCNRRDGSHSGFVLGAIEARHVLSGVVNLGLEVAGIAAHSVHGALESNDKLRILTGRKFLVELQLCSLVLLLILHVAYLESALCLANFRLELCFVYLKLVCVEDNLPGAFYCTRD